MAEFPAPTDTLLLTYLVVSRDVARSRRFYTEVLGGETVLDTDDFAIVAIANGWVTITSPGAPTPDKPDVTLEPPSDLVRVSGFVNIRVANIGAAYDQWRARGRDVPHRTHRSRRRDPLLYARSRRPPHRGRTGRHKTRPLNGRPMAHDKPTAREGTRPPPVTRVTRPLGQRQSWQITPGRAPPTHGVPGRPQPDRGYRSAA